MCRKLLVSATSGEQAVIRKKRLGEQTPPWLPRGLEGSLASEAPPRPQSGTVSQGPLPGIGTTLAWAQGRGRVYLPTDLP